LPEATNLLLSVEEEAQIWVRELKDRAYIKYIDEE